MASKVVLTCLFLVGLAAKNGPHAQVSFGGEPETTTTKDDDASTTPTSNPSVLNRFGLVADTLGVNPLGTNGNNFQNNNNQNNQPGRDNFNDNLQQQSGSCCCTRVSVPCPDPDFNDDFGGAIKPRVQASNESAKEEITDPRSVAPIDIVTRIVNNDPNEGLATCPQNYKPCCYNPQRVNVNALGPQCEHPEKIKSNVFWQQGCQENLLPTGGKLCGQRSFKPLFNLQRGQASPEEFPWTCMMLTDKDRFLGSCAIVPERTDNDIRGGTYRVITAAHKLLKLGKNDGLKVRIIEYDASGFQDSERTRHQEYFVVRFIKHPRFNEKRLSDDIAVLILEKEINLISQPGVNAGCLPACSNMFDYKFDNGTGVRCWVAGWGRDAEKEQGGKPSFIQRKVDVPLYDRGRCELRLKQELGRTNADNGRRFKLHAGEICAGGELGKDACDGDGGAPLVCQSISGHWHVVGLVAWGVGCANPDVPGVYVNVYHYLDFITAASHRRGSSQ